MKFWDIFLCQMQNLQNLIISGIQVARIKLLFWHISSIMLLVQEIHFQKHRINRFLVMTPGITYVDMITIDNGCIKGSQEKTND